MKNFFEYVCMKDSNDKYLFPSPIGHVVFVMLFVIWFGIHKANNLEDEVKHIDMSVDIDTTHYTQDNINIKDTSFIVNKSKYWSSKETSLSVGIVYAKDFAHGDTDKNNNLKDNYVTIKKQNGQLVIFRDIDVDLFLNVNINDTIK